MGQTEEQVKAAGVAVQGRRVPVRRQRPRARHGAAAGFVKLIADAASDEILGVHIIGPMAGELIAEAVLAMEFRGQRRGPAAHDPRASDAVRSAARGGARGRQARDRQPQPLSGRQRHALVPRARLLTPREPLQHLRAAARRRAPRCAWRCRDAVVSGRCWSSRRRCSAAPAPSRRRRRAAGRGGRRPRRGSHRHAVVARRGSSPPAARAAASARACARGSRSRRGGR